MRTPTISADPGEHFDDHFSKPAWQLALNHLATYTGKKRLCLYRWQGGLGLTAMPVRKNDPQYVPQGQLIW